MMRAAIWNPATQQGPGEAMPCSVAASEAWSAWDDGTCQLSCRRTIARGHGNPRLTAIAHLRATMDSFA